MFIEYHSKNIMVISTFKTWTKWWSVYRTKDYNKTKKFSYSYFHRHTSKLLTLSYSLSVANDELICEIEKVKMEKFEACFLL